MSVKIGAAIAMVALIVMAGWQVWGRYVLNDTPTWTTSVTLLVIIYVVFLSAAVGIRENTHLSVTLLRDQLPISGQIWLDRAVVICVFLFGAAMIYGGALLIDRTMANSIPLLRISQGWTYLPLVISGGMTVLFCAERLLTGNIES